MAILNRMQRAYGQWIDHYAHASSTFYSLLDAVETTGETPLAAGETCLIDEDYDAALIVAEVIESYDPDVYAVTPRISRSICSDGKHLYRMAAEPTNSSPVFVERFFRETGLKDSSWSCAVPASVDMINSGNVSWQLWCDGSILILAAANKLVVYQASTGATLWTVTFGASSTLRKVCSNTAFVFAVDGDNVKAYARANGALAWTFDHGGDLHAVACTKAHVYMIGEASRYASGAHFRRLLAADGSSATSEGGTGVDGYCWDVVLSPTPDVVPNLMDVVVGGGGALFIAYNDGSDDFIARRSSYDGAIVWTSPAGEIGVNISGRCRIAVDQDYVWGLTVNPSQPVALGYDGTVWAGLPGDNGTETHFIEIPCSDGSYVWSCGPSFDAGAAVIGTFSKWSRGSTVRPWRRINPVNTFALPLQQSIIPA